MAQFHPGECSNSDLKPMEIPVRKNRQLAVRSSSPRRDVHRASSLSRFPYNDFNREIQRMEREFMNFEPLDMVPFFGGGPRSWMRRFNEEIQRVHNDMMRFMNESDMRPLFDDLWEFPSMRDHFVKDEKGHTIFRAKFNLETFDPEDIEVRVDNQTLSVQAKHTQRTQNSSSGQYFCRAMLLPDGVRTDELKSTLDKNGILTVEAPAPGVDIESLGPSRINRIPIEDGGRRRRFHDRGSGRRKSRHQRETQREYIRESSDGSQSLYITLPIDDIYNEQDIHIRCGGGKLVVEGEKEDARFTRTFTVPHNVAPGDIDAKFYNGVLTITGPIP